MELDPPTAAGDPPLPKLKSIVVRPSMVHAPSAAPASWPKRVWRRLELEDAPMDVVLEQWTRRSQAPASQKEKGGYSPLAGRWERGECSSDTNASSEPPLSPKWQQARKRHWWRNDGAQKETDSGKTRSAAELPPSAPRSVGREAFKWRLAGRCFRCLASDHQVARCRDPIRCLQCNGVGHTS